MLVLPKQPARAVPQYALSGKALLAISCLALAAGVVVYKVDARPEVIAPVAYLARHELTDARTGKVLSSLETAVRGGGTTAQKSNGGLGDHVIWDVAARTETVIDPVAQVYRVAPLAQRRLAGYTSKTASCETYFGAGRPYMLVACSPAGEKFCGYELTRVELKLGTPEGGWSRQVIRSIRQLGWLNTRVEYYDAAGELSAVQELVQLRTGNAPDAFFEVPAGYERARDLAGFYRRYNEARGLPFTPREREQRAKQWASVVAEAEAEGDHRWR